MSDHRRAFPVEKPQKVTVHLATVRMLRGVTNCTMFLSIVGHAHRSMAPSFPAQLQEERICGCPRPVKGRRTQSLIGWIQRLQVPFKAADELVARIE